MSGIIVVHLLLCLTGSNFGIAASDQQDKKRSQESNTSSQDMVSLHMFKLYDKYNRERNHPGDGNTVRSFKATPEITEQKIFYQFNFTSIQESEVVLATTFHFYLDKRPRQRVWPCKRAQSPSCRLQHLHLLPPVQLLFWSTTPYPGPGTLLGNFTVVPQRRAAWHIKDISPILKEARNAEEQLVTAEFDFGEHYHQYIEQTSLSSLPYVLVYADDLSISEPNSVARTLQRYDPFPPTGESPPTFNSSPDSRVRRDAYFLDPIENNELPEVEYDDLTKYKLWDSSYLSVKPKPSKKAGKRKSQEEGIKQNPSPVLSFDEKTMKKERRRQSNQPRSCSRRYLRVDFADIGWSEWILSPKSFDAYYCSGACQFPMPKVVRPSNHATIQSIVKAVGIVAGVPEPCCVPDKMSPLSVLFLDESRNVVLKVYPNMSVQTCACR